MVPIRNVYLPDDAGPGDETLSPSQTPLNNTTGRKSGVWIILAIAVLVTVCIVAVVIGTTKAKNPKGDEFVSKLDGQVKCRFSRWTKYAFAGKSSDGYINSTLSKCKRSVKQTCKTLSNSAQRKSCKNEAISCLCNTGGA